MRIETLRLKEQTIPPSNQKLLPCLDYRSWISQDIFVVFHQILASPTLHSPMVSQHWLKCYWINPIRSPTDGLKIALWYLTIWGHFSRKVYGWNVSSLLHSALFPSLNPNPKKEEFWSSSAERTLASFYKVNWPWSFKIVYPSSKGSWDYS